MKNFKNFVKFFFLQIRIKHYKHLFESNKSVLICRKKHTYIQYTQRDIEDNHLFVDFQSFFVVVVLFLICNYTMMFQLDSSIMNCIQWRRGGEGGRRENFVER